MKKLTMILLLVSSWKLVAQPSTKFWRALHLVETRGKHGPIRGDNGRALGPLQIHRIYWVDSRVAGKYEDCASLAYSIKVASAYMRRYSPAAWRDGNHQVLARIHNGGPRGHKKKATIKYWNKVRKEMQGHRKE